MQSLAHYALLGSLLAGAAGALVITAVTLKYGFRRPITVDDEAPEDSTQRQRVIRLADTVAVLCFAVAAGLGVVGMMQHTRGVPPVSAASEDGSRIADRLEAIESRLSMTPTPEWRAWEERLARLENRLGAVEDRAAVAERRAVASEQVAREQAARERRDARARTAPAAVTPSTPRYIAPPASARTVPAPPVFPQPSASPRLSSPTEAAVTPELPPVAHVEVAPPRPTEVAPPRPASPATTAAVVPREAPKPRAATLPPAQEPSLGDKIRRDWETMKDSARRGGQEWREGWGRVKEMFGY